MSKTDMDKFRFEVVPMLRSKDQIAAELRERKHKKVAALSQAIKQKIRDLMNEGYSIGEVRQELGLDIDEVCGVINENINTIYRLLRSAVDQSANEDKKNEN